MEVEMLQMSSVSPQSGRSANTTGVCIKREKASIETHTERMPCEVTGRDWGGAETPNIPRKAPEAGRETWGRFSPTALGRNQLYDT